MNIQHSHLRPVVLQPTPSISFVLELQHDFYSTTR
jgi:hypothetical protein